MKRKGESYKVARVLVEIQPRSVVTRAHNVSGPGMHESGPVTPAIPSSPNTAPSNITMQ